MDGERIDLGRLAELGKNGRTGAADATPPTSSGRGYTMSERTVGETFRLLLPRRAGAHHHRHVRLQRPPHTAGGGFGGKALRPQGLSVPAARMVNVTTVAMQLGDLLHPRAASLISIDDLDRYPRRRDRGHHHRARQGEHHVRALRAWPSPSTSKLDIKARGHGHHLRQRPYPGATSSPSPASSTSSCARRANVIYEALADVHVSGHACQEELKLIHALTKPKFFIPVHGEYRMPSPCSTRGWLRTMGMPGETTSACPRLGARHRGQPHRPATWPGAVPDRAAVLVDGLGIGGVGNVVLRDRQPPLPGRPDDRRRGDLTTEEN